MAMRLFDYADEDKSGTINFREFSAAFLQVEEEVIEKKVSSKYGWELASSGTNQGGRTSSCASCGSCGTNATP